MSEEEASKEEESSFSVTRRSFIKGSAAVAAGAAALTGFNTPKAQAAAPPESWDRETDVVVAGAGIAGLSAALAAAEDGVETTLIEASEETGGTALFSGGVVHTWDAYTAEELQERVPLLNMELGEVFMDNFDGYLDWLKNTGVPHRPATAYGFSALEHGILMGDQNGEYPDKRKFFDHLEGAYESAGGRLLTETKVAQLISEDDGRVVGVKAFEKGSSEPIDIRAEAVVLTTGSFAANEGMVTNYLGRHADNSVSRCVPYNDGTALSLGKSVGAMGSRGMGTFYGHLQAYPPVVPQTPKAYEESDKQELRELMGAIQNFSPQAVAVNIEGKRFVDESLGDDIINQEMARQPEGRGFIVLDSKLQPVAKPKLELLGEHGAVVLEASSLEELGSKLEEYRVNGDRLAATVEEYNEALNEENGSLLTPPRRDNSMTLDSSPYYAIQATAGISGPYGGLAINGNAEVLRGQQVPIENLYAAPHAAGGIFYKHYGGSLALCGTFGRIAGKSTVEKIKG